MKSGVRYIYHKGKIYFVYIRPLREEKDVAHINSFSSKDCIIEKIVDADTGIEIEESITGMGVMYKKVEYTKGSRITGTKTFYCRSIQDLLDNCFIEKDSKGHYYIGIGTFLKMLHKMISYKPETTNGKGD